MCARTSGTTGQAKLIPVLRGTIQEYQRSQAIQAFVQFSADADAYYGHLLAIVSPAQEGTLASGTPYGSTSGFMYENMPAVAKTKYVLPSQVFGIADYDLKYLLILRLAVTHRDITHIACANPSTLVKLLSVLDATRSTLLEDVTRGTFARTDELSPAVQTAISQRLSCTPVRVAELRPIFSSPRPTFAQLWPELRLVSTWTGGSCRIPLASVRPALPPGARVAELGYLSSELRGTLIADLDRNIGTPTIQDNFFEFVERDDWDAGRKVFLTVEQIEPGKEYYIIATTGTGLYRYFMNDIVRVTGAFHATPAIEFVQKGKGVTNITGEKVYESQVIDAVRSAEEEPGLVSEFFMMLADADHGVYRLVVECTTPTEPWRSTTAGGIERRLGESNVEYAAKRASGRLRHLELLPVRPGTGDAYKQYCLQQGQREGQFKLVALQLSVRVRVSLRRLPRGRADNRTLTVQLEFSRLDIPFTTAFKHSSAVRTATQSVWVSARSDDVAGVGVGCPREYVTGESLASAQVFFADHQEVLRQGIDSVDTLAGWVDHHTALIDANPAAWCAVELAMLELFARREAVPVERVVGVPPTTGEFQYSAVVGDGGPDMLRATVTRYRALGFVDFKLKLSGDPIVDRDKIDTVRDVEHPERLRIRVDANNLWNDAETAVRHLQGLDYSFVGIEEPLAANAFDGMRLVSERTGSPIILDESFLRVEQLAEITGDPERWIINVRVSKMGGLLRSLALVEAARNSGVSIIVGAQVGETSVLTRAGLIVARAAGRHLVGHEGAFGTHLLKADVAIPPLMFGSAGTLNADAHELSTKAGWGLILCPERDFAVRLSALG